MSGASMAAQVLAVAREHPGSTVDEIAAVLGWTRAMASRSVADLKFRKCVKVADGRVTALSRGPSPTQRAQSWRQAAALKATKAERSANYDIEPVHVDDLRGASWLVHIDDKTDQSAPTSCPRGLEVTYRSCLDGYTNAMAYGRRTSTCWKCPKGSARRERYAGGA